MLKNTAISLTLVLSPGTANASSPSQFEQFRDQLLSGNEIIAISDLNQCFGESENSSPKMPIGVVKINNFLIFPDPDPNISFANTYFTIRSDGTPVQEIVQYRITPDDKAAIIVTNLSPQTFPPLPKPMVFSCTLGTGLRFMPTIGQLTPVKK